MKKLVLALAVIASVSMISCTNNNAEQAEVTEDTTAVVELRLLRTPPPLSTRL